MSATHEVTNQPPPLENYNPFLLDTALREGIAREGAGWSEGEISAFGAKTGRAEFIRLGFLANQFPPELRTHDRFGYRIDRVEFHPAWHELMRAGVEAEVHSLPWSRPQTGAHVARAAKHYLLDQVEAGVGCPLTMTFAVVPALDSQPDIAAEWVPRAASARYDPRFIPAEQKEGCLLGMAMTEKQGGSDVRSNTTIAERAGNGGEYLLTGHKWFCSAPMCDAFLTLAQAPEGLSCFLVPRFQPDGSVNRFHLQRLKDKLGNRSNASSEVECDRTWARRVGEEGRGVPTIIEMVNHTRLDCVIGTSGLMRQAVAQAIHHARHRSAFGKLLRDQPLMKNVLADLALDSEAATTLMLHLAHGYEDADANEAKKPLCRIATAIAKYWVCKRGPNLAFEAMECLGGGGYVEESILPRIYREMPVSSIWEGSGNVICLDVLRVMQREEHALPALLELLEESRGANADFDRHLDRSKGGLGKGAATEEASARQTVEQLALALQGALLLRFAPGYVSETFCAARLGGAPGRQYGTLPADSPFDEIIERAMPV